MSCSRNIWWNLAYPLAVNRVRLSASLTVICWHLRLGRRLGAFQIHTIRWRYNRLAPLTVTVTVSVAFRNVSINPIWACQRLHLHLLMISHIINCKCKCSVSKCFRCSGAVSECSGAKSKCSGAVSRDNSKRYTYTTLQLQLGLETTVTSSDCVVWNAPNQRPKRECHHMTVIAADNRARFTVSGYECQVSQDISRKCYRFTLFQ